MFLSIYYDGLLDLTAACLCSCHDDSIVVAASQISLVNLSILNTLIFGLQNKNVVKLLVRLMYQTILCIKENELPTCALHGNNSHEYQFC